MTEQPMHHIRCVFDGAIAKVSFRFKGSLEFEQLVAIEEELDTVAADLSLDALVLNMADIEYFGSRFLGIMAALAKKLGARDCPFVLCRMRPEPLHAFTVCNLDRIIPHYASESQALKAVAKK
jgi:anti-anti-sigma factor